jgi:hypothetical protein
MNRFRAILTTMILSLCANAQVARSDYVPATIAVAIERMGNNPDANMNFDAAHSRYVLTVTSLGLRRPLPDAVKNYLSAWVKSFGHPESWAGLFDSEVAVEQNGRRYWLPIQGSLAAAFDDEAKDGVTVNLYVTALGDQMKQPVIVVNAFQVP